MVEQGKLQSNNINILGQKTTWKLSRDNIPTRKTGDNFYQNSQLRVYIGERSKVTILRRLYSNIKYLPQINQRIDVDPQSPYCNQQFYLRTRVLFSSPDLSRNTFL
jgi:hypothetical protein